MKIYTRVVVDIETLEVVESDSFDYHGRMAECGSSGGGSSGSGKVEYPNYIEVTHSLWLTDVENAADAVRLAGSPYLAAAYYDPDTDITAMTNKITSHEAIVDALDEQPDWTAFIANAAGAIALETPVPAAAAEINADVTAFGNELDAQLGATVYPRFEAGMRDINAVVSSAFVLGRGLIEEHRDLEVAKYATGLRVQAYMQKDSILADAIRTRNILNVDVGMKGASQMLGMQMQNVQFQVAVTNALIESRRIKIVAKSEQLTADLNIDIKDALWDLEAYQHQANMMAAPVGGTAVTQKLGPTQTQSTIGGAMAGASVGGQSGSGYGVIGGAIIGGIAGYLSA